MLKKLTIFFIAAIFFFGAIVFFTFGHRQIFSEDHCPFCQSAVLNYQKFYEDDLVLALYTYKPVMPGHCLIIPKRHTARFEGLTEEEACRIFQVIKKVDLAVKKTFHTTAYLIWQKNGIEVGQTVFHVHFHYIPRKENENSVLKFIFKMFSAGGGKPITSDEMRTITESLKDAMEN